MSCQYAPREYHVYFCGLGPFFFKVVIKKINYWRNDFNDGMFIQELLTYTRAELPVKVLF